MLVLGTEPGTSEPQVWKSIMETTVLSPQLFPYIFNWYFFYTNYLKKNKKSNIVSAAEESRIF